MGDALTSGNMDFFYNPSNGINLTEIGSHLTCHEINGLHEMLYDDALREEFLERLFPDGSKPECEYISEFEQWFHNRYDNATIQVLSLVVLCDPEYIIYMYMYMVPA